MKAIQYIFLMIFAWVSTLSVVAQDWVQQPTVEFHSTSAMVGSGSDLPQAAITGVTTAEYSNSSNGSKRNAPTGPSRVDGWDDDNPSDPGAPLGDTPWVLMALLVAGYAVWVGKKYGVRMPDAGK